MDLLTSLGVNSSLVVQLGTFLVVYVILKYVLFVPYFKAYNQRNERTLGQTELAERYVSETRELEERFSAKAQEVNERFKAVYDKTRGEALKEYDRLMSDARAQAKKVLDASETRIQAEMQAARPQLAQEVASVAKLINHKLLGKDLNI